MPSSSTLLKSILSGLFNKRCSGQIDTLIRRSRTMLTFKQFCLFQEEESASKRLESDGISEWHPSFLTLAPTLKGCSKRYEYFCQQYRHHSKGAPKCHWGSRMLKRLVETSRSSRSKRKRLSPGQQQLPFAFDCRLNQITEDWHQIAVRFRRANGIRDGDRERSIW